MCIHVDNLDNGQGCTGTEHLKISYSGYHPAHLNGVFGRCTWMESGGSRTFCRLWQVPITDPYCEQSPRSRPSRITGTTRLSDDFGPVQGSNSSCWVSATLNANQGLWLGNVCVCGMKRVWDETKMCACGRSWCVCVYVCVCGKRCVCVETNVTKKNMNPAYSMNGNTVIKNHGKRTLEVTSWHGTLPGHLR